MTDKEPIKLKLSTVILLFIIFILFHMCFYLFFLYFLHASVFIFTLYTFLACFSSIIL